MVNLIVLEATSSDLDALIELQLSLQRHCEKSNASVWQITKEGKRLLRQKLKDAIKDEKTRVLIAKTGREVVGYASGQVLSREDYLPGKVAMISSIYVKESFRRRGIGKRLVKELCAFFDSMEAEQVTLRYIIGNKEGEKFWTKLGFQPIIITVGTALRELCTRV